MEADIAVKLVARLRDLYTKDLKIEARSGAGVGVVTPYRRQLIALRRAFQRSNVRSCLGFFESTRLQVLGAERRKLKLFLFPSLCALFFCSCDARMDR